MGDNIKELIPVALQRGGWNKGMKMSDEFKARISASLMGSKRHLGCKHSEETRKRISNANLGKPSSRKGKHSSKETRLKQSLARLGRFAGENAGNWKGGITAKDKLERVRFRETIQKQVFERDKYTCQFCGQRGGKLQVDHIQAWSQYVEGRFDMNNCRTLCMACHYKITWGKDMPTSIKAWGHNLKNAYVN